MFVPGQESDGRVLSLLTIWSWNCAENVLYFSLGKYIKIEQISNTLTGINTWMEEHSRSHHVKKYQLNMTSFAISYQGQWCTHKILHKTRTLTSILLNGNCYFLIHNLLCYVTVTSLVVLLAWFVILRQDINAIGTLQSFFSPPETIRHMNVLLVPG
jgi:hypothetical protein